MCKDMVQIIVKFQTMCIIVVCEFDGPVYTAEHAVMYG